MFFFFSGLANGKKRGKLKIDTLIRTSLKERAKKLSDRKKPHVKV